VDTLEKGGTWAPIGVVEMLDRCKVKDIVICTVDNGVEKVGMWTEVDVVYASHCDCLCYSCWYSENFDFVALVGAVVALLRS